MSKLLELYEKRGKAVADARAFLDARRGDGDILSAEDSAAYEKMEAAILALGREIERGSRLAAVDAEMAKLTSVVPTVAADAPVLAFGDFSYYNIGDRGTRSFAELKELFAGNGMIGFVAKERVDGKLVLAEAVQSSR